MLKIKEYLDLSLFPFPEAFKDQDLISCLKNLENFLNNIFAKRIIKPNYKGLKNVYIGKGTKVAKDAKIIGPCIIGDNCIIGHGAFLRGGTLLGTNVHLGHAVEIKNCIFLNNAIAAHLNYVGDSIVGNNVNIAGGTIIANVRLDKQTVKIKLGKQRIDTGLLKFGSIIGDDSNIGANCVLNPGTILGKKTIIYPLSSVTGIHKEGEIIKGVA